VLVLVDVPVLVGKTGAIAKSRLFGMLVIKLQSILSHKFDKIKLLELTEFLLSFCKDNDFDSV
jgi:hypothetical protein